MHDDLIAALEIVLGEVEARQIIGLSPYKAAIRDHIATLRAGGERAQVVALEAERDKLTKLVHDLAWNERFGVKDSLIANGCFHGFKPAAMCPNEGCEERDLERRIDAAIEAGAHRGDEQ